MAKVSNSLTNILSIVVAFDGFMWVIGLIPTLYYAFINDRLPTLAGIRLLDGPFEKLGVESLIVAGIGFTMVSALKILAGYWLWNSRMDGAVFEVILLGLSAIFWYGFELPLGPLFGIIQVVLLALTWGSLV
jgi:hypothetical protein